MRRALLTVVTAALGALALAVPALGALQPNDPAWPEQWAARQVGMPDVWSITTGDPAVVIALVDTGVNPLPDFADALVPGWDFVENDAQAQDTHGHGTSVASVIVSQGDNEQDIAGYCWDCRLMPVRVAAGASVRSDQIAAGIRWAVDHGARIVNVSLSRAGSPEPAEQAAVQYALGHGVLVVASAGNTGSDAPQYPAAYPGVLSVGATDPTDALYFWSTRGPWVTLTSPGCQMILGPGPATHCGTSFTPAAVAGIAGLILSRAPGLTLNQLRAVLLDTARPVPGIGGGRIDAAAAFSRLGLLAPPVAAPAATPQPRAPAPGQRFARSAQLRSGTFRRGMTLRFTVGKGRLELQVVTPLAQQCTLVLRTPDELIIGLSASRNLLSLSEIVPAGRYAVDVRCTGSRTRRYTMGVMAMFPLERD